MLKSTVNLHDIKSIYYTYDISQFRNVEERREKIEDDLFLFKLKYLYEFIFSKREIVGKAKFFISREWKLSSWKKVNLLHFF